MEATTTLESLVFTSIIVNQIIAMAMAYITESRRFIGNKLFFGSFLFGIGMSILMYQLEWHYLLMSINVVSILVMVFNYIIYRRLGVL